MTLQLYVLSTLFDEEERAGCFAFIVFWMSCYCKCPVVLPHGAVGWSAVCDCCFSLSYLLFNKLGACYVNK